MCIENLIDRFMSILVEQKPSDMFQYANLNISFEGFAVLNLICRRLPLIMKLVVAMK